MHTHSIAHTHLHTQDNGRGNICFVDISDVSYNPKKHMGVMYEDAMETIHAILPSGEVRERVCVCDELCDACVTNSCMQ